MARFTINGKGRDLDVDPGTPLLRVIREQTYFDTCGSMRIAQMPKLESSIMSSGDFRGGVGEPTICVAAPAVLNAFFNATGKRIRSFPLKKHGITLA